MALLSKVLGLQINRQEIRPGGKPLQVDVDASTARARIEAKLDAIASRRAAELPAPPMIDITPTWAPSAVLAERLNTMGGRE